MLRIIRRFIESILIFIRKIISWLRCLIKGPKTCDIRFSLQGRYVSEPDLSTDLSVFGVTNNAITIHGAALEAAEITVEEFTRSDRSDINRTLRGYLRTHGIDPDTDHLVVLDMEPKDPTEPHPEDPSRLERLFHPKDLGTFEGDPRQNDIIQGFIRRIEVARDVMPNAKLGLYQVVAPMGKGQYNESFRDRMQGYRRAGELGMYDQVDYIVPVLYTRFGSCDVTDRDDLETIQGWSEALTRQGIEESRTLTRTSGGNIPLVPYLSFWVFNGFSRHDRQAILPETMRRQLCILQEYSEVEIIVLWSGWETEDEMRSYVRPVEPVNFHDFLTNVGEFPISGCRKRGQAKI